MKISQRILILIVLNIATLLGMAGSIFFLGETEQEYYEQADILISMKSLFIEKQYMEKMILNDIPIFGDRQKLDSMLDRYSLQINRSLLDSNSSLYDRFDSLRQRRDELTEMVLNLHSRQRDFLRIITADGKRIEEMTGKLQEQPVLQLSEFLTFLSQENKISFSDPEVMESYGESLSNLVQDLPDSLKREAGDLLEKIKEMENFLLVNGEKEKNLAIELYETDDALLLLVDNIVNELHNKIAIREDQEQFAIFSGILFIMLISIWATAFLGRSISRPIEELRSYVHSIDLSDIKLKPDRKKLDGINARHNLEIAQLAESYATLEEALFDKMSELEERSESLTNELKERKKTERKLKQTENYLNNIIQSLNSLIITADSGGRLIHWNKQAEDLSEEDDSELFNRFPFLLTFKEPISEVMETGRTWSDNAVKIEPLPDRYFNIHLTPLEGRKSGIVIRLDDITQIRNIENQLLETQKWETLGVLTSGFAHDFNNVLTGIVTSSSILIHLAERNYPELDKTFTDCLSIIDRSGNRAAAMVQQLLSLSRTNELNFTSIDLRNSLEDVKAICGNSFDKSVKFILDLPRENIRVQADNAQLEQIFLNLCINSYHAMTEMRDKKEKNGGELKITLYTKTIDRYSGEDEKGYAQGQYAAVAISDTGVGIPAEKKKKIFDPFFTTKDKSKGTGLGLTMVQHIVNQHKGFIELYSEPGRGTVITVYLPLASAMIEEEQKAPEERILVKGEGSVLVIDDEEVLRVLTESILKECGYDVMVAEDGFKGVDLYRKNGGAFDLVILDMSMPGISGKETFIELKQINPEVRILLASGFIKDDRIQDLMNLGLEDFIQKPFDFIELSEKVARILKG
ncbi:response regulator [Spirochaeta isovalerica]|uniref:histidine kinase n=1 Tax=Spirochaeta isovalerica TaxID=150 RepID=A0A841RDT2_9SPIO|nr:response regulator [Spirochaeta isovalerica]MBB6481009.1 signal transduction histidine kinase/CheY-like chemotaxis protein [Spirochaeta isovalerica]